MVLLLLYLQRELIQNGALTLIPKERNVIIQNGGLTVIENFKDL